MIDFGIPNDKMPASQGGAAKAKLGPAAVGFECRLCTGELAFALSCFSLPVY